MLEVLISVLINLALVLACIFGLALIALVIFIALITHHANKLMWELPWLKWLTLDEIVQAGFSRLWSELLLPLFYEKGHLEIRISAECPEKELKFVELTGFNAHTVRFHDFKLTKRGGRRKRDTWLPFIPSWRQLRPV